MIPDAALMQLATTFTETLEAHGTPFSRMVSVSFLESKSVEPEELLTEW
jgi:hypothetical protein